MKSVYWLRPWRPLCLCVLGFVAMAWAWPAHAWQPSDPSNVVAQEQNVIDNFEWAENPPRMAKQAGPPPLPIHLPQPGLFQKFGVTASGWANGGYTANGYSPNDGSNGIVYLNDQSNEFLLNQLWFAFERKLSDRKHIDWGGRFDILYGSDWRYGACTGLETNINSPDQLNGWCLPQMYLEGKIGRLKIKGGHWASMYSHEVVPAPGNFFYSYSYSIALEPLLTTGFIGEYQLTESFALVAGTQNGWNTWEDPNKKWNMIGGFRWTPSEKSSIKWNFVTGQEDPSGHYNRFGSYLVWNRTLTEKLSMAWLYTYLLDENGSWKNGPAHLYTPGNPNSNIHALCNWLTYSLNEKWSVGSRIEWMCAPDGFGIYRGYCSDFWEFTLGANWRPCPNLVVRPEVRWDWTSDDNVRPFNDGTRSNQCLFAADFIFLY